MGLMQRLLGRGNAPELPPPTYSNQAVLERIEREEGVDRVTSRAWFGEMLIFVDLCARSERMLSPPVNVDKAWHAFLLHTRDYEAYCTERYGRVIHHQPMGESDPEAYRRTYELRRRYRAGGATPDPYLWTIPAGAAADDERDDRADRSGGSDGGGSSCGGGGCGGGGS